MFDAAEHLIEKVRHALVIQIHLDHLAKVRVHKFHHQVDVLKLVQRSLRRERVQKANYLEEEIGECCCTKGKEARSRFLHFYD